MSCVSLSLRSSLFSTSCGQWDSRVAATVFSVTHACVTANLASYQAAVAEDELRHLCSTAGDNNFDNWFRSLTRFYKSGRRNLKTWTRPIDEFDNFVVRRDNECED